MDDAEDLLAEINRAVAEEDAELTPWEASFIESIGRWVREGRELTEKQDTVLERIWKRVTGQG